MSQGQAANSDCEGSVRAPGPLVETEEKPADMLAMLVQDMSGRKFCALICTPPDDQGKDDGECGENASCKAISGVGICTYDE
eukprot:766451-Hanusia_phi.AAC.4